MLLRLLESSGVELTEETRERILRCEDPTQLNTWFDGALDHIPIDRLFDG